MLTIIILFVLGYLFLIAALLFGIRRWRKHLDKTAIVGLDQLPPTDSPPHTLP